MRANTTRTTNRVKVHDCVKERVRGIASGQITTPGIRRGDRSTSRAASWVANFTNASNNTEKSNSNNAFSYVKNPERSEHDSRNMKKKIRGAFFLQVSLPTNVLLICLHISISSICLIRYIHNNICSRQTS